VPPFCFREYHCHGPTIILVGLTFQFNVLGGMISSANDWRD
jgi:hypothetical protein